jgi:hypothetical protein
VLSAVLRLEVPVDPDAPTARRWAVEELADPLYQKGESLLTRLWRWLLGLFERASQQQVDLRLALVVALVVLAVVLAIAFWVAGPVRLRRRTAATRAVLDADDGRTSAQLAAAADAAAARDDWHTAVLERFRSVVRGLEERTVLDERPGRTAHEATVEAGARLADVAGDLGAAGRLFDGVAYGDEPAAARDDAWLRDVAARVAAARPSRSAGAVVEAVPR